MDFSEMICNFRRQGVRLGSKQFKEGWLKIEESSTLTIGKALGWYDWMYLMMILARVDVSRVEHLVLEHPHPEDGLRKLVAFLQTGRFSALKTLRVLSSRASSGVMRQDVYASLIETITRGKLPNLQELECARDFLWPPNQKLGNKMGKALTQAYFENPALTAEVDTLYYNYDSSILTKMKQYRDRNLRLVALREELKEDVGDYAPLTGAKVFLCGYPEVGKTKLRRTLLKRVGLRTKFQWETRPSFKEEPRTRGIELSRITEENDKGEKIDLLLWDLAGQDEYHVLHGTFVADLGFAGGKATTFVLVFRAPYRLEVKEELLYWLRFVASSSLKRVKRHVVIVLNCFDGKQCTEVDRIKWMGLIKSFATLFDDLLDIHLDLYIMDVRVASLAKPLKAHLFGHARALLQDLGVPKICSEIQEELKRWSNDQEPGTLPILTWEAFEKVWRLNHKETHRNENTLKIGASYLHEIGEIVYFDDKELTKKRSSNRSVVVPDPQWFCKEVVGQLLLPKEMLEGESCMEVSANGSVSIEMFQNFFEHLLIEGTNSDDVIAMLEKVSLCYRKGTEEIIVPALIRQDDYSSVHWERQGFHGVMGRSFTVEDKEKFAIPETLFRRLQVELAQDLNFGGRSDSEYRAGKSFSNFKVGVHLVLIQFDVDHSNPTDDRIDILVKSMMRGSPHPMKVRLAQVSLLCEMMQKLEVLCVSCCPGVKYDRKAIKPWNAGRESPKMIDRKLMSLREMERLLIGGEQYLSWQLDGNPLELKSFFSEIELNDILKKRMTMSEGTVGANLCFEEPGGPGVFLDDTTEVEDDITKLSLKNPEIFAQENCSNTPSLAKESADVEDLNSDQGLAKAVSAIYHLVDKRSRELMVEVKAQQAYSIEEKEKIVPRFMFLSRKQGGPWLSFDKALGTLNFQVHLLCESHFDTGLPHEIRDQEGIKIKKDKEWLVKSEPWLRWTLEVALLVSKTVGNIYVPGAFNFIPTNMFPSLKQGDNAANMLLQDEGVMQASHKQGNHGTAEQHIDLKVRLIGQEVVKDLMKKEGHAEFLEKMTLMKVSLKAEAQEPGTSRQAQPSVFWICHECYIKYGDRATNITPIW